MIPRLVTLPFSYLWNQWHAILESDCIDRIVAIMTAKIRKAVELSQSSPFSGALSPEIVRTIQREKERARSVITR
ncbi:MAG: hypothetical protein JO077_14255 [Verrucomicrobia bacterium]|nr:hypothetical protein [Verrucomicrobiota bacterium]